MWFSDPGQLDKNKTPTIVTGTSNLFKEHFKGYNTSLKYTRQERKRALQNNRSTAPFGYIFSISRQVQK